MLPRQLMFRNSRCCNSPIIWTNSPVFLTNWRMAPAPVGVSQFADVVTRGTLLRRRLGQALSFCAPLRWRVDRTITFYHTAALASTPDHDISRTIALARRPSPRIITLPAPTHCQHVVAPACASIRHRNIAGMLAPQLKFHGALPTSFVDPIPCASAPPAAPQDPPRNI